MTTNGVAIHYPEVYEACHRALWHLGKASDLLVPPSVAAVMAEVHETQPLVDAMACAKETVHALVRAFEREEARDAA